MKTLKTIFVFSFLYLGLFMSSNTMAQVDLLVDLQKELFPDTSTVAFQDSFTWEGNSYEILARSFAPNMEKINQLLWDIREQKDVEMLNKLIEIQKNQEVYFLKEWEPAWRIGHHLYDQHYSILMNLELTLSYLYTIKKNYSEIERYTYFKNLIYLQWIDRDTSRIKKHYFFSNYVKTKWNGACIASEFCTINLLIERSNEMKAGILNDLRTFELAKIIDEERNFYLVSLGKAAIQLESDEVEDIYIERIEVFDSLKQKYYSCCRSTWIYNILCARGRIKGIQFLLDDLSTQELLNAPSFILHKARFSEVGKELVQKRLLIEIKTSKAPKNQRKFLQEYLSHIEKDLLNEEKRKLKQIVDKSNFDLVEK